MNSDPFGKSRLHRITPVLSWKHSILLLCFSLFGAFVISGWAQTPSPTPADPILGSWRWTATYQAARIIEFRPDGTIAAKTGLTGVWTVIPSEAVEREYKLTWNGGTAINVIELSADGNTIIGKSETARNHKVKGTRVDVQSGASN